MDPQGTTLPVDGALTEESQEQIIGNAHAAATSKQSFMQLQLDYVDGLRGIAALYVVLYHAYQMLLWNKGGAGLHPALLAGLSCLGYGTYAVSVFIVLSGYCLMLPVALSNTGQLRGGLLPYFIRRARRILPPYYAALFVSLLLIELTPWLQQPRGVRWDGTLPAFQIDVLLSHLLLIHHLRGDWAGRINTPLWSIGVEWELYFLFPLLLLPLWRRINIPLFSAACFGIVLIVHRLFHSEVGVGWYFSLFGLGMAAATIAWQDKPELKKWRQSVPWGLLSALFWICLILVSAAYGNSESHPVPKPVFQPLIGFATVCLLIYCARCVTAQDKSRTNLILRGLQSHRLVFLGTFSYSLYLIHDPLLAFIDPWLRHINMPLVKLLALTVAIIPIIVLAYVFHTTFERPFMSNNRVATKTNRFSGIKMKGEGI